jgi:hypothetical protein
MFNLSSPRRSRRNRAVSPLEALESRTLLSAINVISTPGPSGSVNLNFLGTPGDDTVSIFMSEDMKVRVTGGSFRVNGRAEQSELSFDRLNNVTMNLGAGSDYGSIQNVSLNNFLINDGTTFNETNRYFVGSFTSDVRIKNVDANFKFGVAEFTLQINSGKSMSLESLAVRLRDTTSSKIMLQSFSGSALLIAGQFSVDAASHSQSSDLVLIQASPDSVADQTRVGFQNVVRVNLGGGKDTFQMIGTVTVNGPTFIDSGNGDDHIVIGNIPDQGNIVFRGIVSVLTGDGIDFVECGNSFESTDRVRFRHAVTISTGNQEDLVDLRKSVFEKSLVVDIGNNAVNTMNLGIFVRDIQVGGQAFFRSSGLASINIEAVPDSTSPSRFGSAVVFALRSGRVTIGHVLHKTPKVIFDGAQTYIGTDSTISVKLAGPIQANPAKRRLINAILE